MIGTTISHYRIISQIGAGGMGTVYLAEDTTLRRRVALKFLTPATARNPEAAARLLREARAASALDHPHIATIYEIGEADGQPFIVMAHYDGETLAQRLSRGALPMADAARILSQVADALAAAHEAGIVHRDLKPSNLMLTTAGQVKVLDFGIAKIETGETSTQLTGAGTTVGTAAYMSPEQAAGELVDARSDLWSLGIVTYEMLAGRPPFAGTNSLAIIHAVLTAAPTPIRTLRPDVAPELEEIVSRTLVRDRQRRTITADEIRDLASAYHARLSSGQQTAVAARSRSVRRVQIAAVVMALIALGAGAIWWAQRNAKVRWARQQALPEIIKLAGADRFDEAFDLAQQARRYIPDDPLLAEQIRLVSRTATLASEPTGAEVSYRPYGRSDVEWRPVGKAPIENVTVPRGLMHWKAEMPGRQTAEDVGPGPFWPPRFTFKLLPTTAVPTGMVLIASPGQPTSIFIPGLDHLPSVSIPDFWIDRHEVTNREFKRFVDDGGYRREEFWREPLVKDGKTLTFDAAVAQFRDATGRPGPSTWELGSYPAGQEAYPVAGVSWYEASAYARWAGKSLPTIFHWSRAADQRLSGTVVPASNFSGKGLQPVGSGGVTRGGTTDMAGNVKEWCLNAAGAKRYVLGGAWSEPVYMFTDADAQSPFARHATHGFRCMKAGRPEDTIAALAGPVEFASRDLRNVKPVSEPVFQAWRSLYSFDHSDLHVKLESTDDASAEWRVEKVSYAAAYGDERVPALLFLPKNVAPPYQAVIRFPGSGSISQRSSSAINVDQFNWMMRSGRALLLPIYKSTHERGDVITNDYPNTTAVWRDHMIMWSKDVGRSVDYLLSRPDIRHDKIGYFGSSWGAGMAPLFLAVEPRISLAILLVGGFYLQPALPEADPVNFASRVKIPILMLNGKFDFFFPTDSSQEPMFNLLGTPAEHKRRIVYDTSHTIPRNELIRESVDWMDRYWGPVR
jgi:tRNA A-37 threonylcarbamoyl transferase component Bud32/cephalosporin-C deacetylase-like acetyl esterase